MITSQSSLRKINIEIEFAKNPCLRGMFTRPEARKELEPYVRGIDLVQEYHEGEVVGVDLTGPSDALSNFASKFLSDEDPHVYSLSYRD
jgi:hypothetical protein